MAKQTNKLTARGVTGKNQPGLYLDGRGLYLRVGPTGAKSWIYRYMLDGKSRDMGLGPTHVVTLAEARSLASDARSLRHNGIDPIRHRASSRQTMPTFAAVSTMYIDAHSAGWKNAKHAAQWRSTLTTYAYPHVGDIQVSDIELQHVLAILKPIWYSKTETASRVRMRLESILDYATAHSYRRGENPARWKGHLDKLLPARSKIQHVQHHKALTYQEMPEFMSNLQKRSGLAGLALQFTILTAARTGETLGSRWTEMDKTEKLWTIPDTRMKSGRQHRVPLSDQALRVLAQVEMVSGNSASLFPLSNGAMSAVLKRMGIKHATVHGFRSTFRDWAGEMTSTPNEVCEQALAHLISNKSESAYRRGDMLKKRQLLMQKWAKYCVDDSPSNLIQVDFG